MVFHEKFMKNNIKDIEPWGHKKYFAIFGDEKMKKTNMAIEIDRKYGYIPVYRAVYTNGEHFFIKNKRCMVNVDTDIKNKCYIQKESRG